MVRIASLVLLLGLEGCQGASYILINMTRCPIEVTYRDASIRDSTLSLAPGKSAAYASRPSTLESITITTGDGTIQTYSRGDLEALRLHSAHSHFGSVDTLFAWFDDGLRNLPERPDVLPATDQSCARH